MPLTKKQGDNMEETGWREYKREVLHRLGSLEESYKSINRQITGINKNVSDFSTQIVVFKAKVGWMVGISAFFIATLVNAGFIIARLMWG